MYTQPSSSTARLNFGKVVTNTWLTVTPSTRLIVSTMSCDAAVRVGGVDAVRDHFPVGRGERDLQLARNREHRDRRLARGRSARAASRWSGAGTAPSGLFFGGGRWSLPTSSSVWGAPCWWARAACGAILSGVLSRARRRACRPRSARAMAVAAPESRTTQRGQQEALGHPPATTRRLGRRQTRWRRSRGRRRGRGHNGTHTLNDCGSAGATPTGEVNRALGSSDRPTGCGPRASAAGR